MALKEFVGVFKPGPMPFRGGYDPTTLWTKDSLSMSQVLLFGALCQLIVFVVLPARYALLPTLLLAVHGAGSVAIQWAFPSRNSFMNDVIPKRVCAQMPAPSGSYSPDPAAGKPMFGSRPAAEPVVVMHIGIRSNHPLGPRGPGSPEARKYFQNCIGLLVRRAEEFGCLGNTTWRAAERASNNSLMAILYFKSIEGLNAFAQDPIHREAWDWFVKYRHEAKAEGRNLGIYHETFYAPRGGWETIFIDMPPTLLGAASAPVRNEETGKREFVNTLVEANVPSLKGQMSRMDREEQE